MTEPRIDIGEPYWRFDRKKVEEAKDCFYVADLCIRTRPGNWSDFPVAVFWQPYPKPEHSPYFGLYFDTTPYFSSSGSMSMRHGALRICSAVSVAEGEWDAVMAADGEIIFSRWRHDCRHSTDRSAMVDGGRDYGRFSIGEGAKAVRLKLDGPRFVVVEDVSQPAARDIEAEIMAALAADATDGPGR